MPSLFLVFALIYTISFTTFPDLGDSINTRGSETTSKVLFSIICSSHAWLKKLKINNKYFFI